MSRDRGHEPPRRSGDDHRTSAQTGSDDIARGHQAVRFMEGGFGMPRISTLAASAIADQAFGPARMAAEAWQRNKADLALLARSLDPSDRFVARAQALLDEMRPLEADLPDLFELIGATDDSPKAKARWLARLGRAHPPANDGGSSPASEARSPLRPENIKPDGIGWSGLAGAALGGLSVLGIDATSKTAVDPVSREAATMVNKMLASPEYAAGFAVGGGTGALAAYNDFSKSVADLALLVFDLMKARIAGGELGVLFALRDKIMGLVDVADQVPAAIAAFARRWNDGSDPHAQGMFQGTAVGYITTQLVIFLLSEAAIPGGAYPEVIAALRLLTNPVDGVADLVAAGRAARLARGAKSAGRVEHAATDAVAGERTAARVGGDVPTTSGTFGSVIEAPHTAPIHPASSESPASRTSGQVDGCFVAGTEVLTPDGPKPIETLAIGMRVVAYDPSTGSTHAKAVTRVYRHTVPAVLDILVAGERITCSAPHPFLVTGRGWVPAGELRPGNELQLITGAVSTISTIAIVGEERSVFNISVDDSATYHVSTLGVVVHNKPRVFDPVESLRDRREGLHETAAMLRDELDALQVRSGEISDVAIQKQWEQRANRLRGQIEQFETRVNRAPHYPAPSGTDPYSGYNPLDELELEETRLLSERKELEAALPRRRGIPKDRPALDAETFLADGSGSFARTGRTYQGRQIYRGDDGRLYYVDNLHNGDASEIEVFSATGEHLGAMTVGGEMKPNSAVRGRRIRT